MKKNIIISLILLCFTNAASGAWQMHSEFRSAIGANLIEKTIEQNISNQAGVESFQMPDQQVNSGAIPVTISNIVGTAKYVFGNPDRTNSSLAWVAATNSFTVELVIQRIHAFTIIHKQFNGGVIDLRVEGNCYDTRMSIPVQAGARLTSQIQAVLQNGNLQLQAQDTKIAWPTNAWQIDRLECSGVEGFGDALRKEALNFLSQPKQEVQDGIQNGIQAKLNAWASNALNIAVAPRLIWENRSDIILTTTPQEINESASKQVFVNGDLTISMPNVSGNESSQYKFSKPPQTALADSELQIPIASVRGFLLGSLFAKSYKSRWSSDQFTPFHELMQDRTAQRYAFQDLQNFSTDAEFYFETHAFSAPVVNNFRNNPDKAGTLLADFSFPATILMLAPRPDQGKHVPYVQFQIQVRGMILLKVEDGKLVAQVQRKNLKVKLKPEWNKAYVAKYKPFQMIEPVLIGDRLGIGLTQQIFSMGLPTWLWQNNQRLEPVALAADGDAIKMLWDVRLAGPSSLAVTAP